MLDGNPDTVEPFEVFYDGQCPLCRREIDWIRRRDRQGLICCTDIAAADFKPPSDQLTQSLLMARIHGRLPDGTIIDGVEVFRQLYARIGLAWLVAITRWPLVRPILDIGYNWFARNRGRLTGRCHEDACSSGS